MTPIDLSHLPPLREIIDAYGLNAKKSLGQNFLLDLNLTSRIARAGGNLSGVNIVEIGPGPGGLTRALVESDAKSIIAVEYDPRAISALESLVTVSEGKLQVIHADALETDVVKLVSAPRAIVANLPYNIATPLLIRWLSQIDDIAHMTLMFQREVAERIVATPSTKAYGRLSIIAQWLTTPKILFDVNRAAFTPPPNVTSSVVHFVPRAERDRSVKFETVEKVTAAAFGQRRKMLRQSLKSLDLPIEKLLEAAQVPETARAEEITPQGFIAMARMAQELGI